MFFFLMVALGSSAAAVKWSAGGPVHNALAKSDHSLLYSQDDDLFILQATLGDDSANEVTRHGQAERE